MPWSSSLVGPSVGLLGLAFSHSVNDTDATQPKLHSMLATEDDEGFRLHDVFKWDIPECPEPPDSRLNDCLVP